MGGQWGKISHTEVSRKVCQVLCQMILIGPMRTESSPLGLATIHWPR